MKKKAKNKKIQPHKELGRRLHARETNLEVILISILLVGMFVMLFGMVAVERQSQGADMSTTTNFISKLTNDGNITTEEFLSLKNLSCDDLKLLLGTDREVCIYFRDSNGNIIDLTDDGRYGIGCPGLEVNGQKICNFSPD